MRSDDLLVPQRIADPLHEVRLMLDEGERNRSEHGDAYDSGYETPHDSSFVSSAMTPATQASRSSSVPVLT